MPRSKRNKVVSLTKTKGKGRDLKSKLIESLRENVDEYENIFVVSFENLRASRFKDIRMDWRESRYVNFATYEHTNIQTERSPCGHAQ